MDYFEQQMKDIIMKALHYQIDFSIYPPGGPTADGVAGVIASALREQNFVQYTGIGSRTEFEQSVE